MNSAPLVSDLSFSQVTKLDDISPLIFLNRTKAALNCAAGSMQVSSMTFYFSSLRTLTKFH